MMSAPHSHPSRANLQRSALLRTFLSHPPPRAIHPVRIYRLPTGHHFLNAPPLLCYATTSDFSSSDVDDVLFARIEPAFYCAKAAAELADEWKG